jgi:hypothetical protein
LSFTGGQLARGFEGAYGSLDGCVEVSRRSPKRRRHEPSVIGGEHVKRVALAKPLTIKQEPEPSGGGLSGLKHRFTRTKGLAPPLLRFDLERPRHAFCSLKIQPRTQDVLLENESPFGHPFLHHTGFVLKAAEKSKKVAGANQGNSPLPLK